MGHLRPRKYSERLGVITPGQLQMACDLLGVGSVTAAKPASAGLWGQNILLSTTQGEFVLRGNPEPHQLQKERVVAAAIHGRSPIPVPWPYSISDDCTIFGWSFAIVPLLPGTMGSALWDTLGEEDRLALAAAHGEALAALHRTTFAVPGPYDPTRQTFAEVHDFRAWTLQRIDSLRTRCRAIGALTADAELFIDTLTEAGAGR
jgi:aminoglycoside phosphotransferase (APT) family kinase protein